MADGIKAITAAQKESKASGGDSLAQFAAGMAEALVQPGIWLGVGIMIAAGIAAAMAVKGVSGIADILFKYPAASQVKTDISSILSSPLVKGLSAVIGLYYGYEALKQLNEGDFMGAAGSMAASAGFLALATGKMKAAGYLFVAKIGLEFAAAAQEGDIMGAAKSVVSDPTNWLAAILGYQLWGKSIGGLLGKSLTGITTVGKGIGGVGGTAGIFGGLFPMIFDTWSKESKGYKWDINVGWVDANGIPLDKSKMFSKSLTNLETDYKAASKNIQTENLHMLGDTWMSSPLGALLIQTKTRWISMGDVAKNQIGGIIVELNKIPREIVTTHRIVTVYSSSGKK